jgi:D-alanyl-D-alanine carboxypeptidase (penicillin-binding protein 5/6)
VSAAPEKSGAALDVEATAEAAVAWDIDSGTVLYERNANVRRPVASLSKLIAALLIRREMPLDAIVEITPGALKAQRLGANIKLPVGEHATVEDLMEAGMIASANDAMVVLAEAHSGSEQEFAAAVNAFAELEGMADTKLANATGLSGGEQYSTANDVRKMISEAYQDDMLSLWLRQPGGELVTQEGTKRKYESTNKLLNTYIPILAAKTGYTVEAGENLVIITEGAQGQRIGAVILGSKQRFQDMKVLVEWVWRNYAWNS